MALKITSAMNANPIVGAASAPTVTPQGSPAGKTWTYKIVGIDANGGHTAASAGGSTSTGAAALNGTDYNTVTWTDPVGAVSVQIWRTVDGAASTPATLGLIGTVAAGVQTFDDTGLAGDGATPPGASTAIGYGKSINISAWDHITAFVKGLTSGTWKLQISDDNATWFDAGNSVTNSGYVDCTVVANFARVVISAYATGAPVAAVVGIYNYVT